MLRLHSRSSFLALAASALLAATQAHAVPVTVNYNVAGTGQTASASFEFVNGSSLQIMLAETTPASASGLNGGSAILTSVGFLLPRVQIVGGSVTVAPGSASAGFAGDLSGGADVSHLWGYTPTTLWARSRQAASTWRQQQRRNPRSQRSRMRLQLRSVRAPRLNETRRRDSSPTTPTRR